MADAASRAAGHSTLGVRVCEIVCPDTGESWKVLPAATERLPPNAGSPQAVARARRDRTDRGPTMRTGTRLTIAAAVIALTASPYGAAAPWTGRTPWPTRMTRASGRV